MGMRGGGAAAVGIVLIAACASPPEAVRPAIEAAPAAADAPAAAPAVESPPPPSPTITNPPDVDAAVAEFREFLKTEATPQDLRWRVEDVAVLRDPRVVDALAGVVRSARFDDASREAAARHLVEQGDPHVLGTLKQLADAKDLAEEHPSVLVALLEEIGECDPKQTHEWLLKVGKKYSSRDAEIAEAAFRGASRHATRDVVDELIRCMEHAHHAARRDESEASIAYSLIEVSLDAILRRMAGVSRYDTAAWRLWWGENRNTWVPPVRDDEPQPEVSALGTFHVEGYGLAVCLPCGPWRLGSSGYGDDPRVLVLEVPDGDRRAAWCELCVYETLHFVEKTPSRIAESWRLNNVLKFRELNVAEWDGKATVSGCAGVEQHLVGLHKELGRVELRNRFVERDGVMYYWICGRRLGADASLGAGIALVLDSFELPR